MRTVHKFLLGLRTEIELPADAKPMSVQVQDGKPFLWVETDQRPRNTVTRVFRLFETGEPLLPGRAYIATIQMCDRVYHAYELIRPEAPQNNTIKKGGQSDG